ncbi:MAG: K(+)-transporting ATPase subunit C [Opitutaceae bacterium]|nr:K(+)-transporting ATPase subunit C [Opitutaceae bacterium]HRP06670.1 K(+)-transporting ATPase subunit C [Opitutaceae bacterium]
MKPFLSALKTSALLTLVMGILLCALYPLAVWAGAQLFFHHKANGSLLMDADGRIRGSELIGQPFSSDRYFQPRPSAAGSGYDPMASSGSNLGPTSERLAAQIETHIRNYRSRNGLPENLPVPADAVTASGSGLDPDISTTNADLQASRIAAARSLPIEAIRALIAKHTAPPDLGVLGEPRVNVLLINRALDTIAQTQPVLRNQTIP